MLKAVSYFQKTGPNSVDVAADDEDGGDGRTLISPPGPHPIAPRDKISIMLYIIVRIILYLIFSYHLKGTLPYYVLYRGFPSGSILSLGAMGWGPDGDMRVRSAAAASAELGYILA